jgi:hypothetical protein
MEGFQKLNHAAQLSFRWPTTFARTFFGCGATLKALRGGGVLTKKLPKMSENAVENVENSCNHFLGASPMETVTAPANIFGAFNSTVWVLQKSPSTL